MLYYPCVGLVRHFPFFFNIIIIYSCYISLPCLFLFCVYVYRYCQQLISNIVPTSINVCVGGDFAFVGFVLFRFHFVDFVSFRFVFVDFVSFRFVFADFVWFGFVSFLFRFALYRYATVVTLNIVIYCIYVCSFQAKILVVSKFSAKKVERSKKHILPVPPSPPP